MLDYTHGGDYMVIKFTLNDTLKLHGIKKTDLAKKAGVRNNIITELCSGTSKRIPVESLDAIILALNDLTGEQHDTTAIFIHKPNE